MGAESDLKGDSDFALKAKQMAMLNQYDYDEQRAGFYYNSDRNCHAYHELEPSKSFLVLFNGENTLPTKIDVTDSSRIKIDILMYMLNSSIVKGMPRWSERAHDIIYLSNMSAIVLMME